jgi:hypothetical protein
VEGRLCPCRIKLAWNVTFSGVKNDISKRSVYNLTQFCGQ